MLWPPEHARMAWLLVLLVCVGLSGAKVCQVSQDDPEGEGGVNTSKGPRLMTCPGPTDPANHTHCCYDRGQDEAAAATTGPRCCEPPPLPPAVLYIENELAMMIAVSVTSVCVVITVVILVCCFWPRCPLYTACHNRYYQDDIIAYASKDEETTGLNDMPPEETKGVSIYSPNAVKVTLKDDV